MSNTLNPSIRDRNKPRRLPDFTLRTQWWSSELAFADQAANEHDIDT